MKNVYLTLQLVFFGLFLSCNNTKAKDPEPLKTIIKTETKETFSFVKPANKPEEPLYKTIYNECSISIDRKSVV